MAQNWRFVACGASFFAEMPVEGRCWAKFFAPTVAVPRSCRRCGALQAGCDGGLRHAKPSNGVSELWMASFPPIGGGELAVCGGVVAKLQTHWVKRLQKRLVLLNGSAMHLNLLLRTAQHVQASIA